MITPHELHAPSTIRHRGPKVKICGITTPEHALAAAQAGADMVGVVFAPSRRRVTVEQAKIMRAALDPLSNRPMLVGVFVNETPASVLETAREVGLDMVQLSGDETPEEVAACAQYIPVIKALRFPASTTILDALKVCGEYKSPAKGVQDRDTIEIEPQGESRTLYLLIDAYHPGEYGGTGQRADWALAAALAVREEIILAGGLNPKNLGGVLAAVTPWGVDVSSGVETGGVKDSGLIGHFVGTARSFRKR